MRRGSWNKKRTVDRSPEWRHQGAMNQARTNVTDLDRINLRLSGATFEAVDAARACRPGRISRNTWIAEAIEEKLARDGEERGAVALGKAANA